MTNSVYYLRTSRQAFQRGNLCLSGASQAILEVRWRRLRASLPRRAMRLQTRLQARRQWQSLPLNK